MASDPKLRVTQANVRDALQEAVAFRIAGQRFVAQIELEDPRTAVARALAPALITQFADYDEQRAAFAALAQQQLDVRGQAQSTISVQNPAVVATMRDIAKLADCVQVHSAREYETLSRTLDYRFRASFERPVASTPVPNAVAQARDTVVVWAPEQSLESLAIITFGLRELRLPVVVVSADSHRAGELQRAKVIVDASTTHAGNALALAGLGVSVCCASTSGAIEYLSGVVPYEPWDAASVYRAATTAIGNGAPFERAAIWPQTLSMTLRETGPLVTIGIRTYNRPELLHRALQSVARQTYRDVEAIVVNDAGCDVSEVVGKFPFAKLVNLEQNSGGSAGSNVALAQARGLYIGFLDDDDMLLPEHISLLVDALERSGAKVAHTDTISAFFKTEEDGTYRHSGFSIFLDHPVEPTDFHVSDSIGPMSVMVHTDVARSVGGFDTGMPHAHDWEFYLKLSRAHDFVHVPYITGIYSIRDDSTNMMQYGGNAIADAMQRMLELYPLPDRPLVEQARRDGIKQFQEQGSRAIFPRPPMSLP